MGKYYIDPYITTVLHKVFLLKMKVEKLPVILSSVPANSLNDMSSS